MASWIELLSRPSPTPLASRPSLTLFFLLCGAFLLTLVPHVEQMPFWISCAVLLAMVIRCVLEIYRMPLPSTLFCSLVAICLLGGIVLQFNTMFGREAGTAFIAGLLAIKFYELRGPRDLALIIFSCFFVVMSTLLYSQALELFIYCLIMMWVLTALLVRVQIGDQAEDSLLRMLQRAGTLFLQALPLAVVLFFFLPRSSAKFQMNLNDSPLGLTDTVQPGSISSLSNDYSPAMYVRFPNGDAPSVDTMYWRALVLWDYHHGAWTAGILAAAPTFETEVTPEPRVKPIEQHITIYPHFRKWLFALEFPVTPAVNQAENSNGYWSTVLSGDVLQLSGQRNVLDHKERYIVTSGPLAARPLGTNEKAAGTQLPGDNPKDDPKDRISPDVRALAAQLRQENPDDQAYIAAVFHYFRHFTYSMSPGAVGKGQDWLSVFLFKTRTGFCEHFASAFAVLMRLEHIPARVVVGYQGAEYNPYNNDYVVKQSNAHAWDEVWIEGKGWTRIDPVTILSSAGGTSPLVSNGQSNPAEQDFSIQIAHHRVTLLSGADLPIWMRRALVEMQLRRQEVEASWDDWVFSYDPDSQNRLAQALGLGRNRSVLIIACFLAVALCSGVFWWVMRQRQVLSPVENVYAAFCRHMAQSGVPRALWEGPLAFTGRAAEAFPDQQEAIRNLGSIVARARYGPSPVPAQQERELELLIKAMPASSSRPSPHAHV